MLDDKNREILDQMEHNFSSPCLGLKSSKIQEIFSNELFVLGEVDVKLVPTILKTAQMGEHKYPGTLSLVLDGDGAPTSRLTITVESLPALDGKQIVLGRVIKGLDVVQAIASFGSRCGAPRRTILIRKYGKFQEKRED